MPGTRDPNGRVVRIHLRDSVDGYGLEPIWQSREVTFSLDERGDLYIDHGFFGSFRLAANGQAIDCQPKPLPPWLWQKFLVGQLLPLAALRQGLQLIHAAAVVIGGGAVLVLGTSGAGKTTSCLLLVQRGASFLADDVAAVEIREGQPFVHPGSALANVDERALKLVSGTYGRSLGSIDGEARVVIDEVHPSPAPLKGVVVLTRDTAVTHVVRTGDGVDWMAVLLGSHFSPVMAEHLNQQETWLDVCDRILRFADTALIRAPLDGEPAAVASEIASAFSD